MCCGCWFWGVGEGGESNYYQHRLIVDEHDVLVFNTLTLVQLLFKLEGILIEVLLQLLVGEVDAQLLEAVLIKNFKPEDVQHTNNTCLLTY